MSIGAQLRRYGETALKEDVRALLQSWSPYIDNCSSILLSVPRTMRTVLYEEKQGWSPLRKHDIRVKHVPFVVGKPTYEEVQSLLERVTTLNFVKREPDTQDASQNVANNSENCTENGGTVQQRQSAKTEYAKHVPEPKLPELPECAPRDALIAACKAGEFVSYTCICRC